MAWTGLRTFVESIWRTGYGLAGDFWEFKDVYTQALSPTKREAQSRMVSMILPKKG